jgi:hypothetical protein
MAKPKGILLFTIPFIEKFLHNRFFSALSCGKADATNDVHTSAKHNPTKYTNPLISPFITDPNVKKHTTIKGDKRKNK